MFTRAVILFLGIFLVAPAYGEDNPTVTPYRPSVSNPADLSEPGWLEVEAGFLRSSGGSDKRRDSIPYLVKYAFTPNWGILLGGDARIRRTDQQDDTSSGVGDTSLTVKHRIPIAEGSAFGVELGFKSPTAKTDLGSGKTDYVLNLIYSKDLSKTYHFDLNVGGTRVGAINEGEGRYQGAWASAVSHTLNDDWSLTGELSGTYRRGTASTAQYLVSAGYNVSRRVALDIGMFRGLTTASPDWGAFAGITVLVGKLR